LSPAELNLPEARAKSGHASAIYLAIVGRQASGRDGSNYTIQSCFRANPPRIVIRRVGHLARALPRRAVAGAVWVGAVVETLEILAVVPVVAGVAHAPGDGELDRAPTVEGAVILAVLRL